MKGRRATKDERLHMARVQNLGCIVCLNNEVESPAEVHHLKGKTADAAHFFILPLCPRQHRIPDTEKPRRWKSLHGDGKWEFQNEYGLEIKLLQQVKDLL